jgi:hypothetical protein
MALGKADGESGDDQHEEGDDVENGQNTMVGKRQRSLHQREPAGQTILCVWIGVVQLTCLLLVGGGVAIVHERQTDPHPVNEAQEFQIPVEPSAGLLLPKHDREKGCDEAQLAGVCGRCCSGLPRACVSSEASPGPA